MCMIIMCMITHFICELLTWTKQLYKTFMSDKTEKGSFLSEFLCDVGEC